MRVNDLNVSRNATIRLSKRTIPQARFDGLDILIVREFLACQPGKPWRKPYGSLTRTDLARRSQPIEHVTRILFRRDFRLETARTLGISVQAVGL